MFTHVKFCFVFISGRKIILSTIKLQVLDLNQRKQITRSKLKESEAYPIAMIVKWCQKCKNDLKVHIEMYTCELANSRHCCGTVFPSAHAHAIHKIRTNLQENINLVRCSIRPRKRMISKEVLKCSCKTSDIKCVVKGHLRRHSESVHGCCCLGSLMWMLAVFSIQRF